MSKISLSGLHLTSSVYDNIYTVFVKFLFLLLLLFFLAQNCHASLEQVH